jgi:hypothetical protein
MGDAAHAKPALLVSGYRLLREVPSMITFVVDTVTGTVIDTLFASVMVTVHEPVSFPGVTVKLTAAPADTGVALAGLTCATYAPDVGTGEGAGLVEQAIAEVNAAALFVSETLNVAVLPPAVNVSEFGDATGVGAGVGGAAGVA